MGAHAGGQSQRSVRMLSALAQRTSYPERLLVVHYFCPGHLLQAVDVVPGPQTSPDTVEIAAPVPAAQRRQSAVRAARGLDQVSRLRKLRERGDQLTGPPARRPERR